MERAGEQEVKPVTKSQELAVQLVSERQGVLFFHRWQLRLNSLNHSADLNDVDST